jgi:hypothetical protein
MSRILDSLHTKEAWTRLWLGAVTAVSSRARHPSVIIPHPFP